MIDIDSWLQKRAELKNVRIKLLARLDAAVSPQLIEWDKRWARVDPITEVQLFTMTADREDIPEEPGAAKVLVGFTIVCGIDPNRALIMTSPIDSPTFTIQICSTVDTETEIRGGLMFERTYFDFEDVSGHDGHVTRFKYQTQNHAVATQQLDDILLMFEAWALTNTPINL